ncbi:MAG: PfkB family carbohydrate kinase [Chloroflexota bacterium]|nr:MAG: sugar kinase [Chloroflexota bacterium]
MSTLVVGSVALDTVETPYGRAENALGGTATYFSLAASLFTDVQMVGVVGDDFPQSAMQLFDRHGIDLSGLQQQHGQTFRWVGEYHEDMNVAHTLDTRLNVFETFHPRIPEHYRNARFVFLGNIDPELQLEVLRQVRKPEMAVLDTMNFWIERKRHALTAVLRQVDAVLINEGEVRQYTGHYNVLTAAREVQEVGPRCVVVKRGEYGALMFYDDHFFAVPAFPTSTVRDTTGAGDSFAGAFLGHLEKCSEISEETLRASMVYGTVAASFAVEDFSIEGLMLANERSVMDRYQRMADVTRIEMGTRVRPRDLVVEGL